MKHNLLKYFEKKDIPFPYFIVKFKPLALSAVGSQSSNQISLIPQVYSEVVSRLSKAFAGVVSRIGDPLLSETLIGPLHTPAALEGYKKTVAEAVKQGGKIEFGGKVNSENRRSFV